MNIALRLSGGIGARISSDIPKQYIKINNKAIIGYCIDTINRNALIDKIVIVAEESWHKYILEYCQENGISKFLDLAEQGKNRQLSILNGLEVINKFAEDDDLVFIHDAARPLLSDDLINRCINAVSDGNNYDGALPVLPMKDTVYYSENGKSVSKLLNRSNVYAGQAPEVFKFRKYYEANLKLLPDKILNINVSSEVAILAGMNIAMIEGDENNFKITTQADLDRFKEMVKNESLCPT